MPVVELFISHFILAIFAQFNQLSYGPVLQKEQDWNHQVPSLFNQSQKNLSHL